MRNHVVRHAFEALPVTVLSTPAGRMVLRVLERNSQPRNTNKKGGKK